MENLDDILGKIFIGTVVFGMIISEIILLKCLHYSLWLVIPLIYLFIMFILLFFVALSLGIGAAMEIKTKGHKKNDDVLPSSWTPDMEKNNEEKVNIDNPS